MKTLCLFAPHLNHAMETIGFYFRTVDVKVLFVTQTDGDERSEHPWSLRRIAQDYEIRSILDDPIPTDLLIADAFVNPKFADCRVRWASQAAEIAFLFPHDGLTVRSRAAHLVRSWPHSLTSFAAIFVGDRRSPFELLPPFLQKRIFYSPYLHPELLNKKSFDQIFSHPSDTRLYSIGFIGNRNPPERMSVLNQCREAIKGYSSRRVFWVDYGDDDRHKAVAADDYMESLGNMDFSICPAGWGGCWTHRVVESLCMGAIPILPDPHLYGLNLSDSINCIAVNDGNWRNAISTALNLSSETIQRMRRNILDLRAERLSPNTASSRFCAQF